MVVKVISLICRLSLLFFIVFGVNVSAATTKDSEKVLKLFVDREVAYPVLEVLDQFVFQYRYTLNVKLGDADKYLLDDGLDKEADFMIVANYSDIKHKTNTGVNILSARPLFKDKMVLVVKSGGMFSDVSFGQKGFDVLRSTLADKSMLVYNSSTNNAYAHESMRILKSGIFDMLPVDSVVSVPSNKECLSAALENDWVCITGSGFLNKRSNLRNVYHFDKNAAHEVVFYSISTDPNVKPLEDFMHSKVAAKIFEKKNYFTLSGK